MANELAAQTPGIEFARLTAYLDAADRRHDQPVFEVLADLILSMGLADTTVVRGVPAMNASGRASLDQPVIVEAIGPRYRIDAIVSRARRVVGNRLMTVDVVEVVQ